MQKNINKKNDLKDDAPVKINNHCLVSLLFCSKYYIIFQKDLKKKKKRLETPYL